MAVSMPSPFFLLSLFFSFVAVVSSTEFPANNITHLHFYFHEIFEGAPNSTSFIVAGLNNAASTFGNIRVFDNALREGPEPTSKLVGRAQGMVVDSSLGPILAELSTINFVLTDGRYNGSSLALFGRADAALTVNERSIVGGSGFFRLARGYSLSRVISYTSSLVVIEFDMFVAHD